MENFNYYMTFSPKEFEYGNRELILEKRIPLDLYLENYAKRGGGERAGPGGAASVRTHR